ncbi:hypothetical protein HF086_006687, partial [Spodoptera exigua]
DLSRNELTAISRRTFRGLTALKSLHIDGNHLKCIDEKAFENLKSLEVLTLNNNNLTYLSLEPVAISRLNTLRLTDNPVVCDCRVARLATTVRAAGILGVGARCQAPAALRGALLTELEPHELICSGPTTTTTVECSAEPRCPPPCRCTPEGTVDCREKLLSELPSTIPHRATEIRLEQNEITEVGAGAFASVKRVARIDLSNNKITKLAADAFTGLVHLTSLSLYDNNIRSLPNGTFDALTGIQTLHLGRNPFACDCSLRWLAAYLRKNPIETSGAKCDSPKRMSRKRIDALREENFKCKPGEESANACGSAAACPAACACELMSDNSLGQIKSDGLFGRLPDLTKLDLRNNGESLTDNKIKCITPGAFDHLTLLSTLNLESNPLDCTCHISWLPNWLRSRRLSPSATCRSPAALRDANLHHLEVSDFKCTGEFCEKKIPYCTKEFNPCENGAVCTDHHSHYTCTCPKGYSGQNCTINADDCINHMCQNGASCVDGLDEYRCACAAGYAGRYCEAAPHAALGTSPCAHHDCVHGVCYLPQPRPLQDPCVPNPCARGGRCVREEGSPSDYTCRCRAGTAGPQCELRASINKISLLRRNEIHQRYRNSQEVCLWKEMRKNHPIPLNKTDHL